MRRARRARALVLLVLLALAGSGCRGARTAAGVGAEVGGVATVPSPTPSPAPRGRLLVGLTTEDGAGRPTATFGPGDPVVLVLIVENRGAEAARLTFPSGQTYDFWIERDGREVWRWSADRAFSMAVREVALEPGERRVFKETWPRTDASGQAVPAGAYDARGSLTVQPKPLPTPPLAIRLGG